MDKLHIMPVNDGTKHIAEPACPCTPIPESSTIYVHQSADGREKDEEAAGKSAEGKGWEIVYGL